MPGGYGQQPGIILLREGTDTSQGKAQLISNINACQAVMDSVRSTLGPRGMDKLLFDGTKVTIKPPGASSAVVDATVVGETVDAQFTEVSASSAPGSADGGVGGASGGAKKKKKKRKSKKK